MSHPVNERAARPEQGKAGPLKTALVSLLILLTGIAPVSYTHLTLPTSGLVLIPVVPVPFKNNNE